MKFLCLILLTVLCTGASPLTLDELKQSVLKYQEAFIPQLTIGNTQLRNVTIREGKITGFILHNGYINYYGQLLRPHDAVGDSDEKDQYQTVLKPYSLFSYLCMPCDIY